MPKVGVALRFLALAVIFVPWFLIQTNGPIFLKNFSMLCCHLNLSLLVIFNFSMHCVLRGEIKPDSLPPRE